MIPVYLVVILTITIVVGTKYIVKRNVIIYKLDLLEALGTIIDIYSNKIGTLT